MEVTKVMWFELNVNSCYLDEFKQACEELDIKYAIGNTDVACNSVDVAIQVMYPQEMFYLGQHFEFLK